MEFTEENIVKLFGHEAAEDETIHRLREYYVQSDTHTQFTADLPLRILVGHKGIGKSAVLTMAKQEDMDRGNLSVLVQPDDIQGLNIVEGDFNTLVKSWKEELKTLIAQKILESLGGDSSVLKVGVLGLKQLFEGKLKEFGIDTNKADDPIIDMFLKNRKVIIYLDDLDRGWDGSKEATKKISSLLNAIRDLIRNYAGVYFRIALRTDVYYLVRTSDESTDKLEGAVIWHSWKNHDILSLLVKRIETFHEREFQLQSNKNYKQQDLQKYLTPVFDPIFTGRGKWSNIPVYRVLMTLVRNRPRDLVKLCTLAARQAHKNGNDLIKTEDLLSVFKIYSQGRLQDTINEYRSEFPSIEILLQNMKPSNNEKKKSKGFIYTKAELRQKIKNVLENQPKMYYSSKKEVTPDSLLYFLYKIDFITARKVQKDGYIIRSHFEVDRYLADTNVDYGFDFEIHPAFRWALSPDSIDDIFQQLDLSAEG